MRTVSARSITKKFKGVTALKNVSVTANDSETIVVLGPNGAGKSTLLKIIAGLYKPTSGKVIVLGENAASEDFGVRKEVSFLGENYSLYDNLTAKENLVFFAKLYGLEEKYAAARINELMEKFDAYPYLNRKVGELSRGTKQKVAVCRALLNDPKVFLLDEPTAFLDAKAAELLHKELRRLEKEGRTILYATQRLDEVYRLGSKILFIVQGKIISFGDVRKVMKNLKNISVEVTFANPVTAEQMGVLSRKFMIKDQRQNIVVFNVGSMDNIPNLVKELAAMNTRIIGVSYLKPSLEELMKR